MMTDTNNNQQKYALYVIGDASGLSNLQGWLMAFDLESRNGLGDFLCSADPTEAYMWNSAQEALAIYNAQSVTRPLRDDGLPNRPMRAYTVQLVPVPATIVQRALARQKGH